VTLLLGETLFSAVSARQNPIGGGEKKRLKVREHDQKSLRTFEQVGQRNRSSGRRFEKRLHRLSQCCSARGSLRGGEGYIPVGSCCTRDAATAAVALFVTGRAVNKESSQVKTERGIGQKICEKTIQEKNGERRKGIKLLKNGPCWGLSLQ